MKKIFAVLTLLFGMMSVSFAQTVIVKSKKTVYTRKGKEIPKEKRTFTVTYPLFNGNISIEAKKNLEKTTNYWKVFDTSLEENLNGDYWLYEMSYEVNYNKNSILAITLDMDGSGAYPDRSTKTLVIDLKTGEQVKFADVFRINSLDKFATMINDKLKAENADTIKSIEADKSGDYTKEDAESLKEQLNGLVFTAKTFDEFSVSDKGVTIIYDAEFPHAIQALQPAGQYFFTWAEVKSFIKPDGLLGKFVS